MFGEQQAVIVCRKLQCCLEDAKRVLRVDAADEPSLMRSLEPGGGRISGHGPHVDEEVLTGGAIEHILIRFGTNGAKPHVRLATRLPLPNVDRLGTNDPLSGGECHVPISIAERARDRDRGLDDAALSR